MLAGHSAPWHYTPSRSDSLSTKPKESSVSRPLSTQALDPTAVEFTYLLQNRRMAVLASHSAPRHYTPSRSN